MDSLANLFKGDNLVPALLVAFASFLAGMLVELAVVKLSSRKGGAAAGGAPRSRRDDDKTKFEKRHPAPADGSVEIYVGNLSYEMPEDALRKEFEAFGKVNSARIVMNKFNNRSKGFGFVQMPVRAEAEAAVKAIDGKELFGRKIKCNEARNLV
jgi:hypothetical protein